MGKVDVEITDMESLLSFPHVEPVTIVTSISEDGVADAAVKTWIAFVNSKPPTIAFSCNMRHQTAKNILATKEFVVNFPSEDIVKQALLTAQPYSPTVNKIEKAGLTAVPSKKVKPPCIKECMAHLECILEWTKQHGEEIIIAGRIVAGSIEESLLKYPPEERTVAMKPIVITFHERYAVIKESKPFP